MMETIVLSTVADGKIDVRIVDDSIIRMLEMSNVVPSIWMDCSDQNRDEMIAEG